MSFFFPKIKKYSGKISISLGLDCLVLMPAEIEVSYSHYIPARERIKIQPSKDVFNTCNLFWPGFDHVEYFYILFLNRNNQLLGVHQLSKGGFTGTVINVRVIFQVALKASATSIIACHNHPSGSLTPSDADPDITMYRMTLLNLCLNGLFGEVAW